MRYILVFLLGGFCGVMITSLCAMAGQTSREHGE